MVSDGIPGTLAPADTAETAGEPRVGSRGYVLPDPSTVYQRQRVSALIRISRELREMLADADPDDPDVQSLQADCVTLLEIAGSLLNPVKIGAGGVQLFTTGSNDQASWAGACVLNNGRLNTWVDTSQYEC